MRIQIITPSYNKPEYVLDAIQSIINQTYDNWEYTIIENSTDGITRKKIKDYISNCPNKIKEKINYIEKDFTEEIRKIKYVPAIIVNEFYKKTEKTDLLFYISDDDYITSRCFSTLVDNFKNNHTHQLFYFKLGLLKQVGKEFNNVGELPAMNTFGKIFNEQRTPVDYLDGGQIMFKKEILETVPYPYFEEKLIQGVSGHCDGLFLEKLANKFTIPPIVNYDGPLGFHRITTKSAWRRS